MEFSYVFHSFCQSLLISLLVLRFSFSLGYFLLSFQTGICILSWYQIIWNKFFVFCVYLHKKFCLNCFCGKKNIIFSYCHDIQKLKRAKSNVESSTNAYFYVVAWDAKFISYCAEYGCIVFCIPRVWWGCHITYKEWKI